MLNIYHLNPAINQSHMWNVSHVFSFLLYFGFTKGQNFMENKFMSQLYSSIWHIYQANSILLLQVNALGFLHVSADVYKAFYFFCGQENLYH